MKSLEERKADREKRQKAAEKLAEENKAILSKNTLAGKKDDKKATKKD